MSWLYAAREPEPECMEEEEGVNAYAGAAAERHLERLDARFVRELLGKRRARRVLDVGCGPARIPAGYLSGLARETFAAGVDLSLPMLREARRRGFTSVAVASAGLAGALVRRRGLSYLQAEWKRPT